jgi:apolipoprotein D and lipocalin family protein
MVVLQFFMHLPSWSHLKTAENFDLHRYMGVWYEMARFPSFFEKDCDDAKAQYTLLDSGKVEVINSCVDHKTGQQKSVKGVAWVPDPQHPSQLRVRFFWPFYAAYWVVEVAPDYSYALVGHPSYRYLWILSRSPNMPESTYQALVHKAQAAGFDVNRLQRQYQDIH